MGTSVDVLLVDFRCLRFQPSRFVGPWERANERPVTLAAFGCAFWWDLWILMVDDGGTGGLFVAFYKYLNGFGVVN